MFVSISVADIVDSDGSVFVEGVGSNGSLAVSFEVEGDNCLFVPCSKIF